MFKEFKKQATSDTRHTLPAKVQERIDYIEHRQTVELPKHNQKLKSVTKKINEHYLDNFHKKNTAEFWETHWDLNDIKDEHEDLIKNIKNNELVEYLLDAAPFIYEYFAGETSDASPSQISQQFNRFVNKTGSSNKGDVCARYMAAVEGDISQLTAGKNKHNDVCETCNVELTLCDDCEMVCPRCGLTTTFCDGSLKFASYQHDVEVVSYVAYKRVNHFSEWLSQFQGTESTVVPSEVFEKLAGEFKKLRIVKTDTIKPEKIRELLKKLKLNKYYEHVPFILRIMQGKKPPTLTREMEQTLRKMFTDIQEPFARACPKTRKNFLSYSYVIFKFCELLEWDDIKSQFTLLKSRQKLHQQDVIWKKICNELRWEFVPSL